MSLDTLLEAARFLELQEQTEQNRSEPHSPPANPTDLSTKTANHILPAHTQIIKTENGINLSHNPLPPAARQFIRNSFDIINPLIIDESSGEQKRKQPPMVFRSGTREVHNKLEKHRRAHLKECFDFLKQQLPATADEKKTSNLSILHSALRHIQALKRKERELEHEMERLAREKVSALQKLAVLKKDISVLYDNVDFAKLLPEAPSSEELTNDRINLPRQQLNGSKEVALSVVPVGYPMSQGLVLQKVALVPKGLTDLPPSALVANPTTTVTHFIAAAPAQQINGKVVPLVNAQYVVKPVVVVSSASRTS